MKPARTLGFIAWTMEWPWAFGFCFLNRAQLAKSAIFVWVSLSRWHLVGQHVHRLTVAFGYPVRTWIISFLLVFTIRRYQFSFCLSKQKHISLMVWTQDGPWPRALKRHWAFWVVVYRTAVVRLLFPSGSHAKGHWTPLPNRVPGPRLHTAIQMMMIMAAAEYLLNARHPHTIFWCVISPIL